MVFIALENNISSDKDPNGSNANILDIRNIQYDISVVIKLNGSCYMHKFLLQNNHGKTSLENEMLLSTSETFPVLEE